MKLINKISRYFLLSSVVIFIIVGGFLYIIIENTVINEIDEQLLNVYQKTVDELKKGKVSSFPPLIEIKEIPNKTPVHGFKNVLLKSSGEEEEEPYRQYTSTTNVNGKQFQVIVRISLIEKEDMFFTIFGVTLAAIFLLLIIMFFITKKSSQRVLKDFYGSLNKLENFSLTQDNTLELNKSNIEEFDKLNKAIRKLSVKAISEYKSLKEFTEETNHEIQTPVAVTKSKLEVLLQSENLKEYELNLLNSALNNLNKLERVNKSILLLNKLDHKNLFEDSKINLANEIKNVIESFSDSISSKNISLNISLNDEVSVTINSSLLHIILSNIISNAIKHNIVGGEIFIELGSEKLTVLNSVNEVNTNSDKFFERFYKESKSSDSVGLGLTIVKKICDLYEIDIDSNIKNRFFTVTLNFDKIINDK